MTPSLSPQILFVQIDTSDDSTSRVTEFFGIDDDDVPTCRLINLDGDMKKFVPDFEGMDFEGIRKFASDYLDGNLKVGKGVWVWSFYSGCGLCIWYC